MSIRKDANGKPTRLYGIWKKVRQRCNSSDNPAYHNYGGRGIYMTSEWNDFENFYNWSMSHGYREGLSVDRINNDGPYSPENCRWATNYEQANNTRHNRKLVYDGQELNLGEVSRLIGVPVTTLHNRIDHLGWSMEEALRKEKRHKPNCTKVMCVETGQEFGSLKEAAAWVGVAYPGISLCCQGKQKSAGGYHWKVI